MSVNLIRDLARSKRFAPRVDGKSLVLSSTGVPSGESEIAQINNAALANDMVVIWDYSNYRFRTSGVLSSKLAYINVAVPGVAEASKAVVLNSSRGIMNIEAISAGSLNTSGTVLVGSDLMVVGTTRLNGTYNYFGSSTSSQIISAAKFVSVPIRLESVGIVLRRSGSDRVILNRPDYAQDNVVLGNSSENLFFETRTTDLYHRIGSTDYKIWDERNDGAGTGLNADLLDNYHASSFLLLSGGTLTGRVVQSQYGFEAGTKDNISTRVDSGFFETSSATTGEGWPVTTNSWYHLLTSTHLNTGNYYSLQFAADFYNDSNLYVRCTAGSGVTAWKKLWHAGNDGSGSGLDADILDGQQGSFYRNIANISGNIAVDASNGNPSIWSEVNYYSAPRAYAFQSVIARYISAANFQYFYFCSHVSTLFSVRATRIVGSFFSRDSGGTYRYNTFDNAIHYNTSDQWSSIGHNTTVYFPAYGGVPVIQTDGNRYVGISMTVHLVIY